MGLALLFFFSLPPNKLWWLSFIVFFLFSLKILTKENCSSRKYFFIFLSFGFFQRMIVGFQMIPALQASLQISAFVAFFSILLICFFCALPSAMVGLGFSLTKDKSLFLKSIITFAVWIVWDLSSEIFLPTAPYLVLSESQTLRATIPLFGEAGWRLLFYGLVTGCAASFVYFKKMRLIKLGFLTLILYSGLVFLSKKTERKLRQNTSKTVRVNAVQVTHQKPAEDSVQIAIGKLVAARPFEKSEVTIWPEALFTIARTGTRDLIFFESILAKIRTHHILGARRIESQKVVNSSLLVDPTGHILAEHIKEKPFPIGEHFPFRKFWFELGFLKGLGPDILVGDSPTVFFDQTNRVVFIPLLCYEALDSELIFRRIQRARSDYPGRPLVFVSQSNDGLFAGSTTSQNHAMLVRFRALQFGLPSVQANVNEGSEITTAWGQILALSQAGPNEILRAELPLAD